MPSSRLSSATLSGAFRTSAGRLDAILAKKAPTLSGAMNLFFLCLLSMNGLWNVVPGTYLQLTSHISVGIFWFCMVIAFFRIHGRIPWHLWTCRFAFIFLCWILLSMTWSIQPLSTTYSPAVSSICIFFYYCYVMDQFSPAEFKTMLFRMFTLMFAFSILMVIFLPGHGKEILLIGTNPDNVGAWKGAFRQKNELGLNCAVAFGLCLGYSPKGHLERFWRAGLMVVTLFLSYKSQSRESWVAIALVIFLAAIIKPLRRYNQRSRLPTLVAVFFVVVIVAALVYLNLDAVLSLLGRDRTLTGRSGLWEWSLMDARRHPWIGYGLYGFWQTGLAYDVVVRAGWQVTSSHNSYLDVVISYGLIGLALYLPVPLMAVIFSFRAIMSYSLETFEMFIYMLAAVMVMSVAAAYLTYVVGIAYLLVLYTVSNLEKVERSGFMRLDARSS
jgi:O-antigen ligase